MPVKIFKPNPRNTGAIGTLNFGPAEKGGSLNGEIVPYINILLQASWDEATKRGSFKENSKNPEKHISVKLSEFEAGHIINSIKRRVEWKGFHTSGDNKTQISFTPSTKDNVFMGFRFSCLKNGKDVFAFTVNPGEAECLLIYLDTGLKMLYSGRIKNQNFQAGGQQARPAARPQQAAPKPQEEDSGAEAGEEPFSGNVPENAKEENPFE